jgi:hypothetical protein
MDRIKIGDWVEALIYVITFGYGERIALWVAKTFFNSIHADVVKDENG